MLRPHLALKHRRVLLILAFAVALLGLIIVMMTSRKPPEVGLRAGRLRPCPESPNCVSSQADDELHRIAPLKFEGTPDEAFAQLKAIIDELPRTKIVMSSDGYLHAEFTSRVFRFVDDVEFLIDPSQGQVDVRSCSRIGYSDQGVNRKRVEQLRALFETGD